MFVVSLGEAKPFAVKMWGRFTICDGEVPRVMCHTLWMVWLSGGSIADSCTIALGKN